MPEIRELPIAKIQPAPYNPRVRLKPGDPRWQRLERSIEEFDLVQPLVWNETTGHLVGGHQRLEVLRTRGATTVQVVVVTLPLEREQALNIALNNDRIGGDWDLSLLGKLLDDLQALPDFDPTLTGFDEKELNQLLWQPVPPEELPQTDPEPHVVSVRMEVSPDDWGELRPELDELIKSYPDIRLHVRLPSS